MNFLKSKLWLSVLVLSLLTASLSAWGLQVSSSSKKEIEKNIAQLQALVASQKALTSSNSQAAQTNASISPPAPAPAPSKTPVKTNPNKSTQSPNVVAVTDAAKQQAQQDIFAISGDLESYWADYAYYPDNINYSTFSGLGNDIGQNFFTPPAGVSFKYTPLPSGCTTASQKCQHYTLDALDSVGNAVVPEKKDLNNY